MLRHFFCKAHDLRVARQLAAGDFHLFAWQWHWTVVMSFLNSVRLVGYMLFQEWNKRLAPADLPCARFAGADYLDRLILKIRRLRQSMAGYNARNQSRNENCDTDSS